MTLTQLRYFLAVVDQRGFVKASGRVFVAQSALSTQIKKLEDELGAQLLVRGTEGIRLTAAGEVLCMRARSVFAELAACQREICELVTEVPRGTVRVGITMALSRIVTVPLLHRVQSQWPGISLHIREALSSDIEQGLAQGELDLGVGLASGEPDDLLREEHLYLVGAFGSCGPTGPPIDLSELPDVPLLLPTRRYTARMLIDDEVARLGRSLAVRMELDSLEQSMELVMAGEVQTVMLLSMFLPSWRAHKVSARILTGLRRLPRLFVREPRTSATRASAAVKQAVKDVTRELTDAGVWPVTLDAGLPAGPEASMRHRILETR